MKNIIILIAAAILTGTQCGYAQKKQYSDYNLRKALELVEQRQYQQAQDLINEHLKENPDDCNAYVVRGFVYRDEGYLEYAIAEFTKSLKYWHKNSQIEKYFVYQSRAELYIKLKEYDRALSDIETAYNIAKKSYSFNSQDSVLEELLTIRAHIYYKCEKYEQSDQIYKKLIAINPPAESAIIGLARNKIAREQYTEALELLDKCVKIDPNYDVPYRFRMRVYDKLGEVDKAIDEAINYYEKSRDASIDEIEPIVRKHLSYTIAKVSALINSDGNSRWIGLRPILYEWSHNYAKAIADYDRLEREYGSSVNLYYYRGECYCNLGDMDSAIKDMSKAIEMQDKDDYILIVTRADYYRLAGRYKEAITDFTKAIEIDPSRVYGYYKRGWSYELMGDDDSAMEDYNTGIDIDKSYPYIYLTRGEMRLKRGDRGGAALDFEQILKQDTIANGGSCRHYALHFLGRDNEAVEWMNRVIANDPEDNGNYYDQACLYSRMGRKQEAVAALRTALEKGYRSFAHIEADDDLDAIRELAEFKSLIEEYKSNHCSVVGQSKSVDSAEVVSQVQMRKMSSGVYEVPCKINGLPLRFIFDTGASTVTISSVEAAFMLKNGYLKEGDIKGKHYYSTASGDIHEGTTICLREIKIGDVFLRNIEASVTHGQKAPLLLGQSVMERFGTITIDNTTSRLTIKHNGN